MTERKNRQWLLARRPQGLVSAEDFRFVDSPVAAPADGEVLVRNLYLSCDPTQRGWIAGDTYLPAVKLGEVVRSFAVGKVVESKHPKFKEGQLVQGLFGWQDYAVVEASGIERRVEEEDLPLSTALGVMGINGVTAHYGLLVLGQPKAGETVVVSTAAGAVGSCVGQIAKIQGCRTVGIAGGPVKRALCVERFGFDAAVDYKAPDFAARLEAACAGGVDVYFDNTAGAISDAVMARLNVGARVVICGTASVPSWSPPPQGPRVERHLLVKRARMQGFVIFDHADHHATARRDLAQWLREGRLAYMEDVLDGIEQASDAIAGLYRGENLGKRLIRLAAD